MSCYDTLGDRRFRSCTRSGRGKSRDVCRTRYLANKTTWRHMEHPRAYRSLWDVRHKERVSQYDAETKIRAIEREEEESAL